jgi:tRNA pseudouridine32 synthase/23S rRNA pseudouridine746 synthase
MGEENGCTRVLFKPLTGRTHQLRIHAAHRYGLNAPIVGDALYGRGREGEPMMLHATSLCISHPVSGVPLTFESKVPF